MKSVIQKITGPAQPRFEREIQKAEFIAAIRQAVDLRYRRLCEVARADWERLIGSDPSDACVTVRVQAGAPVATRGSGFLKSRRQRVSKKHLNSSVPHFAH